MINDFEKNRFVKQKFPPVPNSPGSIFFQKNHEDLCDPNIRGKIGPFLVPSFKIRSSAHDAQLKELMDIKR